MRNAVLVLTSKNARPYDGQLFRQNTTHGPFGADEEFDARSTR
jgi:hypothetical protein